MKSYFYILLAAVMLTACSGDTKKKVFAPSSCKHRLVGSVSWCEILHPASCRFRECSRECIWQTNRQDDSDCCTEWHRRTMYKPGARNGVKGELYRQKHYGYSSTEGYSKVWGHDILRQYGYRWHLCFLITDSDRSGIQFWRCFKQGVQRPKEWQ